MTARPRVPHPAPRRRPSRLRAVALAAAGLLGSLLGGSCAAPDADIHLAPLFTAMSTPGGGRELEGLGGVLMRELPAPGASGDSATARNAFRPLGSEAIRQSGEHRTHYLPPFGLHSVRRDTVMSRFMFAYFWQSGVQEDGSKTHSLMAIPGVLSSRNREGVMRWGWFPFYANIRDFLTFDRLYFVFFPIYTESERNGVHTRHVLWPFVSWSWGGGSDNFRIWPFYGRKAIHGRFRRTYVLWPFFHFHRNHLGGGGEQVETKWMVFPLVGHTRRATYRSWTVLWPFFGFAWDPPREFWSLDAPWPLVRISRGGTRTAVEERTRMWPLYSYYKGDRLENTHFLWPLGASRKEDYVQAYRRSIYFVPFLQSSRRVDKVDGTESTQFKLWPLYQSTVEGPRSRTAMLAINPFPRYFPFEYHYRFLYEGFAVERDEFGRSQRAFAALWREEAGRAEVRRSIPGLWAQRSWLEAGTPATETSLLFGLLRWRHVRGDGLSPMMPAVPGPGWPPFRESDRALAVPAPYPWVDREL
jgi:hypothetical protein